MYDIKLTTGPCLGCDEPEFLADGYCIDCLGKNLDGLTQEQDGLIAQLEDCTGNIERIGKAAEALMDWHTERNAPPPDHD